MVAPGTYNGSINFLGKAITVTSSGGPGVTTLNGNGVQRVVTISTNEGPASVLSGFTIRGGSGGIVCQHSSPTISNCIITANATNQGGGGVRILSIVTGATTAPSFTNCRFIGNTSIAGTTNPGFSGEGGGGIFGGATAGTVAPTFVGCEIANNTSYLNFGGGGAFFTTSTNAAMSVDFTNCRFHHNDSDRGGAIGTYGVVALTLRSCRIEDNTANAFATGSGVGGALNLANTQTTIVNSVIARNSADLSGSAIVHNGIGGSGLGIFALSMQNSTIVSNFGTFAAIQHDPINTTLNAGSCIFWNNSAADFFGFGSLPTVSNSIVQSPFLLSNPTNLSVDPGFIDLSAGDYHFAANSPCVGTGALGAVPLPSTDLDGTPRIVGTIDRGADEVPVALLPGTNEDFDLYVRVDGAGDPLGSQIVCPAGSTISTVIHSPLGAFVGAPPILAGQFFATSMPPLGIVAYPAIHLDAAAGFVVYGNAGPNAFSVPGLPPNGVDLYFLVPPGLGGMRLRLQAIAVTAFAANGLFVVSAARDLVF